MAENADEDTNCDWKYHEQRDVVTGKCYRMLLTGKREDLLLPRHHQIIISVVTQ